MYGYYYNIYETSDYTFFIICNLDPTVKSKEHYEIAHVISIFSSLAWNRYHGEHN